MSVRNRNTYIRQRRHWAEKQCKHHSEAHIELKLNENKSITAVLTATHDHIPERKKAVEGNTYIQGLK